MSNFLWILFWLQLKHFIVDFPLQGPYQYKNKGTWLHPGGFLHSGLHFIATACILVSFLDLKLGLFIALIEGILHYLIDYSKMNLNKKLNLTPTNSEQFWWLLGFDQWLHQLTYIGILVYISCI